MVVVILALTVFYLIEGHRAGVSSHSTTRHSRQNYVDDSIQGKSVYEVVLERDWTSERLVVGQKVWMRSGSELIEGTVH